MANLATALGSTLLTGQNQPGLASPVFSYPKSSPTTQPAAVNPQVAANQTSIDQSQADYANLLKQIQALQAPAPFTYSTFDTAANSAKARSAAEGAVNPLYQQKLQTFLQQQQTVQNRAQADAATQNQQLQQALADTLSANATSGDRATQDAQTNVDQTNNQADQFQQDSGSAFNTARNTLAGNVAGAGLTGSGIGAGQQQTAQDQRNTTEGRQVQSFNTQRDAVNLLKTRTLQDLSTSNDQANTATGQKTAAVKLNLDRTIEDLNTQTEAEKNAEEIQRQQDILSQQQNYEKTGFDQFLNTLSGQNRANTAQVYGSIY